MDLLEFKTPLHEAAHNAQVDKVKELLAAGASVTEVDSLDQTPLIMAVRRRAENEEESEKMAACAKLFIDAGADVNAFDKNGEACIHLAVMSGGGVEKVAVLKTLLDAKADTTLVSDTFKMTALHWAAAGGHTEIAKLLIGAGCRKNKISRQRVTPLELAKYKQKRIQDNINHLGEEFSDAAEKTKLLKKYTAFVEYLESVPGVKKSEQ
mmetsp:Transcript_17691/g.57922  ORF Transcript_17691/g.57922 Transcript_17691/m.57922 type:complete len:209 (-) Transcript_17691:317-943(-)